MSFDIKMTFDPLLGDFGDIEFDGSDFVMDGGFETSELITTFTDIRVLEEEALDSNDLGGWFGTELLGYEIGSKIWLLRRSKINDETLTLLEQYFVDGRQWKIDEGIIDSVTVTATKTRGMNDWIDIRIIELAPDGVNHDHKFKLHWDNQLGR